MQSKKISSNNSTTPTTDTLLWYHPVCHKRHLERVQSTVSVKRIGDYLLIWLLQRDHCFERGASLAIQVTPGSNPEVIHLGTNQRTRAPVRTTRCDSIIDSMTSESHNIDSAYERRLGKKLALIEELRAELGTEGIQCPGVIVVGAQSAGKSSVLERLTNIAFPRAENTCTRVPTIVQLQTGDVEAPHARVSRHADFKKAISCTSMKAIQDAIISISEEVTSEVCPIKDEPIHIQYEERGVGYSRCYRGDGEEVRANENMVVLVVIPANDDFGNSEALRIAQGFDPDGIRTIGVVSKCDLVPERSDIVLKIRMSRESDVKLALGFIAVRNKGPGEEDVDINSCEESLFLSHPLLSQLLKDQRGYSSLTKKIVDLQTERVDNFIPEAIKRVKIKTKELEEDLEVLGTAPTSAKDRQSFLTKLLCNASDDIASLIRAENVPKPSKNISARSHDITEMFGDKVRKQLPDFLGTKYGKDLEKLLAETTGYSLPNFMNDSVFRNQVHEALFSRVLQTETSDLITKMQELVLSVYREVLLRMSGKDHFPKLVGSICDVIEKRLEIATGRAKQITEAIVAAEKAQVYTQNPVYTDSLLKVEERISSLDQEEEEEEVPADLESGCLKISHDFLLRLAKSAEQKGIKGSAYNVQLSIHCYVDVVLKRLFDIIPMIVRNVLVFETLVDFHHTIQATFSTEEALSRLLSEPPRIREKRENLKSRIVTMADALKKLQSAE